MLHGTVFSKRVPLAAGGRSNYFITVTKVKMKIRSKKIVGIIFIFSFVIPYMVKAEKAVAWIVAGYDDCKVTRFEKGEFKECDVIPDMPLYPGDKVEKKDNIKSVQFSYLPYFEPKIKDDSTAIIINNAPGDKETIFAKIADWLGLVKTKYKELRATSRGELGQESVPLENATLMAGSKITFDDYYIGKTLVFKGLEGKEVFRKTFTGNDLDLLPGNAGLEPGKMYIREIIKEGFLQFRSTIRVLGKKDEEIVNKALAKIDREKMCPEEKIIKKAAYLQYISDLYPAQVDLYWLSYQLLDKADIKDERLENLYKILLGSCFDHLKGGITEVDFALLLDRPGCLVTVELTRELETNFVPPDFPFKNYDEFSLHFQVNFEGYLIVLHENEDQTNLAFPVESIGYKVKPGAEYRSCTYRFVRKPSIKTYLFILSDNPMEEMEKFENLPGNKQRKLLAALSKRAKEQGQKLYLEIIGSKSFAKLPGKSFKGIIWFKVSLED
jgi:hypothetical protein